MWETVAVSVAIAAVTSLVGLRVCMLRRLTSSATERLDQLQSQMTSWEIGNGIRMRDLRQRMTDVEDAVVRAHDDARSSLAALAEIGSDLLGRIEAVEQEGELEVLVAEGRIPAEHLRPATSDRAPRAADRRGPPPAPAPLW
jgi:hypothetical protein